MPTYEYQCDGCGHRFDEFQSFKDDPLRVCPGCKEDSPLFVLRVYSMRATRIKRYLWALNSVLGFGILMFGLLTFERIRDEGFPVFIGFCIFTYAFCRWWNEDGVEICTRQRGHRLRW